MRQIRDDTAREPRPISFAGELRIEDGSRADWPYFAKWHYRSHHLGFVKRVVVLMEHTAKGEPKLLHRCNLPLTGAGVVDMVITDLGVFAIDKKAGGMELIELAPGVPLPELRQKTEASFRIRPGVG